MQIVNRLTMFSIVVSNMPKAKEFYADKLGLQVTTDYRQDDDHWWVSLALPEGGVTITLSTYRENIKPGNVSIYFATSDVDAARQALTAKGVQANPVMDDLYGPGSGVRFFNLADPDGNWVHIAQA
jgi:catechol 2,3-dioxygenase-like lactoylglutathione lyase family enzyme